MGLDVLLGGITGLLGSITTGIMNYKTMKLKNEHELNMVKAETDAMKIEAEMNIAVTKAEIEGAVELADAQTYMKGQSVGNQQAFSDKWIDKLFSVQGWTKCFAVPMAVILAVSFGFVDFLRGVMRPAITIYLTGMTSVITWMAWDIIQKNGVESMSILDAIAIYDQVISIVIYLTVTCICWWFSDRRMAKFLTEITKNKGL
jgi:hypothetical protein